MTIPRFLWCESIHDVVRNKTEIPRSEGVHNVQFYVLYSMLTHVPFLSLFVLSLLVEIPTRWAAENCFLCTVNDVGNTALHEAARIGRRGIVGLLLEHHANVDIPNRVGGTFRTSLMLASREGEVEIAQTLLQHGVGVDSADNDDMTGLHWT